MEASITLKKVGKLIDDKTIVAGLTFGIERGSLVAIIGANDTCNPAARTGEGPLAGMPIIDADVARTVVIIKRSLSVGYAGVDNDLFYMDKTMMLFGDGKKMMNELNTAVKEL